MEEVHQSNKDVTDKISEVGEVVDRLSKELKVLNENFQSFNRSSWEVGRKANKLLWWYVVLTGAIAISTAINVIVR